MVNAGASDSFEGTACAFQAKHWDTHLVLNVLQSGEAAEVKSRTVEGSSGVSELDMPGVHGDVFFAAEDRSAQFQNRLSVSTKHGKIDVT